jgi:hypothetical protein
MAGFSQTVKQSNSDESKRKLTLLEARKSSDNRAFTYLAMQLINYFTNLTE